MVAGTCPPRVFLPLDPDTLRHHHHRRRRSVKPFSISPFFLSHLLPFFFLIRHFNNYSPPPPLPSSQPTSLLVNARNPPSSPSINRDHDQIDFCVVQVRDSGACTVLRTIHNNTHPFLFGHSNFQRKPLFSTSSQSPVECVFDQPNRPSTPHSCTGRLPRYRARIPTFREHSLFSSKLQRRIRKHTVKHSLRSASSPPVRIRTAQP